MTDLDELAQLVAETSKRRTPPFLQKPVRDLECGHYGIRIARDGTWYHDGTPFQRETLVKLFAGVLKKGEDGRYYLITPVEAGLIDVEDAPFVAVEMQVEGEGRDRVLVFRTNLDEAVEAGPEHPLRFEIDPETGEPSPYVHVRDELEALIARPVFYELVELATEEERDGETVLGVWSGGEFFPITVHYS